MPINREAFISNYLDELRERVESIDKGILFLKKDPQNEEALNKLLRDLHTIKGSSRMLKFNRLEQLAHGLENVFKGVKEKRYSITRPLIQLVFIATDYFKAGAEKIKELKDDKIVIKKLLEVFEKAYANEPYILDGLKLDSGVEAVKKEVGIRPASSKEDTSFKGKARTLESDEYETIRIKINRIDKIIKNLNNLIIKQFQFKKQNEVLGSLENSFRELMIMESNEGKGAKNSEYKNKENECLKLIQNVSKSFSEEISLLERNTFEVQEEILSLRMLPMELVLGSLGKMVEESAIALGKDIDFKVSGSEVMLDKIILEKLHDPIIHLVRNAVDHGIESPVDREARGKDPVGRLEIKCYSESGSIIIKIKDDGKGIDYEKIRRRAMELNPMQEDEIRAMSPAGLNSYLFMPGFSTKERVSDLSGRGVGLDIVRFNIEQIKGKISLISEQGKGSEFTLSLPLSLATVEGFFVTAGGEKFLIPSNFVKEVLIVQEEEKLELLNKTAIKLRDKIIPLYYLSSILDKEVTYDQKKLFVLVVESFGEMIGIIVDSVIQYSSLIYKALPKNLNKLKVIQGIVFDESYNVINILYVPEIVNRFKRLRNIDSRKKFSLESKEYKHILIVDDSYSTREIEKSILEVENYNVTTAVDGIDGLEKLRERYFHLIISDIDMPRMDGLTFVENLKRDEKYKETPVIIVSSNDDPEIRRRFAEIGADTFIIKSDFDRGNLLHEVKNLIG